MKWPGILQLPVQTPGLSRLWIGLVTPVPAALARALLGSLISEVVADSEKYIGALIPPPPEGLLNVESDPGWAGEMVLRNNREIFTELPQSEIWREIEGIGGISGWFGADILWWLRGALDRMVGGVGLRRWRPDPRFLRVGESMDFWPGEALEPEKRLRLYAQMILRGKAWPDLLVSTPSFPFL